MGNNTTGSSGRPKSIKEALRVLDEALAAGTSFQDFVSDEFKNLKSAFSDVSGDRFKDLGSEALHAVSDFSERGVESAVEGGRRAFTYVDSRVRVNPWPFIGGVALGGVILGMIIGQTDKEEHHH